MQQPTRPRQALALRVLLFMVGLLLLSWPFWSAPVHRGPGFLFIFLFLTWVALILALWMVARVQARQPRPPGEQD